MAVLVLGEGRFLFVKQQGGRVEDRQAWEGNNTSRKGPHHWHEEGGNKQANRLRASGARGHRPGDLLPLRLAHLLGYSRARPSWIRWGRGGKASDADGNLCTRHILPPAWGLQKSLSAVSWLIQSIKQVFK